ncbi:hypothetical protein [Microbispora sp. ATCC PTA-5024]|uniref:hypothetical protein n=1 Tax=Microbispora sp. ATCC PTA-5024 TaxID=316330 RepID=UPI0003DCD4D7|nr:hypothetical protein [Microbispora sp. ATCC PTA-5024]ETK36661.1 hypothetical protein MPTA5024_08275 [Microbispora sp. ATCC PTA-5024]
MSSWAVVWAVGPVSAVQAPRPEAVGAVLLVCVSTLVGAFLARRNSKRMSLWLAVASAMILVTALVDLAPDAWAEAAEAGVPPWALGLSAGFGFLVITYFTRRGCACPDDQPPRAGMHAPGLHRRVKQGVDAAVFGGMGTAAALTLHRAIEGAALALTASVVVVIALVVHSASEGLALAALLDIARRRLVPWLVVACLSPAVGVLTASLSPLPDRIVPILLAVVMGVLCRTAIVGMKLAAGRQEGGRLSSRHIAIAAGAAAGAGILLAGAHTLDGDDGHEEAAGGAMSAELDSAEAALTVTPAPTTPPRRRQQVHPSVLPPTPHPGSPARSTAPGRRPGQPPEAAAPLSRSELSRAVRSGRLSLTQVLQRTDPVTRQTPVRSVLSALPGATAQSVRTLLAATGIGAGEQVADLSDRQRRVLLTAVGDQASPAAAKRADRPGT